MLITNSILKIIVIAVFILLIFRLLNIITVKFTRNTHIKQVLKKALFAVELLVWITIIYKIAVSSINNQPVLFIVMILLLILLMLWSFLFVFRDYFAGIIIKISARFKLNETISIVNINDSNQTIKGKITKFNSQNIILEQQNKSLIEIPYNKLFNKTIERNIQLSEKELILLFSVKNLRNKDNFENDINVQLFELPWINHKYEHKVTLINKQTENDYFEVKINLVDIVYKNKVEEILRKNLEK